MIFKSKRAAFRALPKREQSRLIRKQERMAEWARLARLSYWKKGA